jgi:phosphinothricin acetyltransferase
MSQQPPIKTRIATISDLPDILYIINHSITTSTSDYRYDTIDITNLHSWYQERIKNNEPVFVATMDDRVVGYATYCQFRERIGFQYSVEHSIYCHHDYQGQGIGSVLMNELILFAKNQKIHTMVACIDSDNTNSIVFHKKFGFQQAGQMKEVGYKFGRYLDMTLMQLMLNNN